MPHGIGDGYSAALGEADDGETAEAGRVYHRLHIAYPGIKGNLVNIPVRQAVAARVVSDESVILRKSKKEWPQDRELPVIFKMTEPMCRLQQRCALADCRICEPHTV